MSTVVMHNVVSVDGFIADARIGRPLLNWYANGDTELLDGGPIKVSRASANYVQTMWAGIGSMVIGRHLFDTTNGWAGLPPAGEHVVVVSHRPGPTVGTPRAADYPRAHRERRTTSSAMWPRRSQRPRNSPGSAPSPWRRATSAGRHSPSAW